MLKERNPFVASVLSIIPGLGQIYNGQLRKGLAFLIFDLLFPVIFRLTGTLVYFSGLLVMLSIGFAFIIYRIVDGFRGAQKLRVFELKSYNKWYYYALYISAIIAIRFFLDFPVSTGIQGFKIVTPSMIPTMEVGDRFIVDLNTYNKTKVEYGDIVAYNSPKGVWIARVIGLPLDSIELVDGEVFINNEPIEIIKKREYVSDDQDAIEFEETLGNNRKIRTLRYKNYMYPETRTMEKIFIPENEYFLMGDSRDNAYDSRFLGTIKRHDIVGKAIYNYWGKTNDRMNIDLK